MVHTGRTQQHQLAARIYTCKNLGRIKNEIWEHHCSCLGTCISCHVAGHLLPLLSKSAASKCLPAAASSFESLFGAMRQGKAFTGGIDGVGVLSVRHGGFWDAHPPRLRSCPHVVLPQKV